MIRLVSLALRAGRHFSEAGALGIPREEFNVVRVERKPSVRFHQWSIDEWLLSSQQSFI